MKEEKKNKVFGLLDTMAESQEHYKVVIDAAEKSGIFKKFPLSKHQASQGYFNDYIKPSNELINVNR
jgi:hypothetical protein